LPWLASLIDINARRERGPILPIMILFVLNEAPYGDERAYNALRLAQALLKRDGEHRVAEQEDCEFGCGAKAQQKTPESYYNERMLNRLAAGKATILTCGTCMDARGMKQADLMQGAQCSTMDALAEATAQADKLLTF
jgi:uncharacterized protein involved in oxidation of intracellular sulfur